MSSRYRVSVLNVLAALAVVTLVVIAPVTASSATPAPALQGTSKGSSAGTWLTATPSAATQAGNVMIASVVARMQGSVPITPPAGWTLIRRDSTIGAHASLTQALYFHVATAAEPASYGWQFGATALSSVTVVSYSNVDTTSPIVASSGRYISDSKHIVAPSINVVTSGTTVLGFFSNNSNRAISPPAGFTENFDTPVTGTTLTLTSEGSQTIAAAGATGEKTARVTAGGGASSNIGQLVGLKPGTGTPPTPTPAPTLSVATVSPVEGTTVVGSIRWEASTSVPVSKVEFFVDGALKNTQTVSPYMFGGSTGALDTTTLADGAHSLTAKATAADGTTAQSTVSVAVANAPVAPPPTPSPGGAALYAANSVWNTPISANPTIDSGSSTMVSTLVTNANSSGFAIAAKSWTVPIYYADASTPKKTFALTSGWGNVSQMANVPVPAGAKPDPAGDAHMMIVDRSTNCEYDFWHASQASNGNWSAEWGNTTTTTGSGTLPFGLSARASGFALGAGLILPDEMNAGQINHALVFAYSTPKSGGPIYPATSSDGSSTIAGAIPEGAHLQLDPTLNLDALGLNAWQKTIARALQTYGMILGDHGGALSLYAQNATTTAGAYPWGDLSYAYLPTSVVSKLRVLQLSPQFTATYKVVSTGCAAMS